MPMGDGTGPYGMGPRMGRHEGHCHGPYGGFGGHEWRNRYHATGVPGWLRGGRPGRFVAPEVPPFPSERDGLRRQAEMLEVELRRVRARLDELEQEQSSAD